MHRNDFNLLADWVHREYSADQDARVATAESLAETLDEAYAHFDRAKFVSRAVTGRRK